MVGKVYVIRGWVVRVLGGYVESRVYRVGRERGRLSTKRLGIFFSFSVVVWGYLVCYVFLYTEVFKGDMIVKEWRGCSFYFRGFEVIFKRVGCN